MTDSCCSKDKKTSCCDKNAEPKRRPLRNLTSLSLNWLADKFRRKEKIKEEIQSGSYKLDSGKVAESIVNREK